MNPITSQNNINQNSCGPYPTAEQEVRDVIISRASNREVLIKAGMGKMVDGEISRLLGRALTMVCIDRRWRSNPVDIRGFIPAGEQMIIKAYMPHSPQGPAIVDIDSMVSRVNYTPSSTLLWFHEVPNPNQPSYGPRYLNFNLKEI